MPSWQRIRSSVIHRLLLAIKYLPFASVASVRSRLYSQMLRSQGQGCTFGEAVTIVNPRTLSLGDRVSIHPYCYFLGSGNVTIGSDVSIATGCVFVSETHNMSRVDVPIKRQGLSAQPITIGRDVWLGARVVVLGNVSIGDGAVIGAGAVVTRDVPPFSVSAGVPARVVGSRVAEGESLAKGCSVSPPDGLPHHTGVSA